MQITRGKIAGAQKVVIYGPEGVGKTTFASQFPDPLFTDTEGSTHNIDVARLPKPTSWTMLLQQIDFIKQNGPCKTFIVDTIDWAERLCIEFVCDKSKKSSITEFGYGEGFIRLEEEFGKFLNRLSDLIEIGINVVLTAHAKITKFEQPDEFGAYDRWELKLGNKTTAKTSSLVKEWADMLLFATYKTVSVATDNKGTKFKGQGKKRIMYTSHHPAWDAKNRHELPEELPFDYTQIAQYIPGASATDANHPPNDVSQRLSANTAAASAEEASSIPKDFIATITPMGREDDNPFLAEQKTEAPPVYKQVEIKKDTPAPAPPGEPPKESPLNDFTLPPSIPKALADLMKINRVAPEELKKVVAQKGYYPEQTPIDKYDPCFINGVLVGAWAQVLNVIMSNRGAKEELS